jgi:hypothetical protein
MVARRSLGRRFGWLWAAYVASTFGTWLAFDAFGLIAILVLHAGTTEVSVLAAAGLAVGAAVAVPLGPWVEFRRKRPVMVAMDLTRFAALMSVLAAWSVTSNATIAAMTAAWGLLADLTSARTAIAVTGLLILMTPLSLFAGKPSTSRGSDPVEVG